MYFIYYSDAIREEEEIDEKYSAQLCING